VSDERERNEPRDRQGEGEPDFEGHGNRGGDQLIDRQGEGEPDFEGHGNRGGDQLIDRQGEGEPDFEGHRFIEKQGEKFIERHDG
jgi:hypothetical protein